MPEINYKWFYKWISQDDYTTQQNQVLFSTWLDLNSDTYSVWLEANFTEWITTNWHDMRAWFHVRSAW
jgi:hypothetical protein